MAGASWDILKHCFTRKFSSPLLSFSLSNITDLEGLDFQTLQGMDGLLYGVFFLSLLFYLSYNPQNSNNYMKSRKDVRFNTSMIQHLKEYVAYLFRQGCSIIHVMTRNFSSNNITISFKYHPASIHYKHKKLSQNADCRSWNRRKQCKVVNRMNMVLET